MPVAAGGQQADDVGVAKFLEELAFPLKPRQRGRIGIETGAHHFHRHGRVRLPLEAMINRPHGSMPDFLVDDKRPNGLTDQHDATPSQGISVFILARGEERIEHRRYRIQIYSVPFVIGYNHGHDNGHNAILGGTAGLGR